MSEIFEIGQVPNFANVGDKWIDLYRSRALFTAVGDYSNVFSSHTINATKRPGAVALVFSAINYGGAGDFIDIIIENSGTTGVSTISKTGDGTFAEHYVYTFGIFDDDSSNSTFIALIAGDADLVASGLDATDGLFDTLPQTTLKGALDNWRAINVHIDFVAQMPEIITEETELPRSIPVDIQNSLADRVAATLLKMDEGSDRNLADRFDIDYGEAEARARKHRVRGTAPSDVYPS